MHGKPTRKPLSRMRAATVSLVLFLASNGILAATPPLAEELPPIGKGHMLSEEQITYCLAQTIRVEAIRPLVNRYRREQVEFFNAVVAAFNARCQSYRYEGNARDNAKAQVEAHHAQIEADARDSYTKRFAAQEKEQERVAAPVSAPTAPPSIAAAPGTPATTPGNAATTPGSPPAKPAPSVAATSPSSAAAKPAPRSPATDTSSVASKPAPGIPAGGPGTPTTPAVAAKPAPAVPATVPDTPATIPSTAATTVASETARPATSAAATAPGTAATTPSSTTTPPIVDAPKPAPSVSAAAPSTPPAGATSPKSDRESSAAPAVASEPRPPDTARATTSAPSQSVPSSPRAAKPEPSLANAQPPASSKPTTPSKTKADADVDAALDRFSREIRRAGSQVIADSGVPAAADKGTTQIDVRYATGGYIKSINVGESSGYPALDERALDIARNTRFPNVPQELQSHDFVLRFPIVFRSTAAR
jgi:TonB family protein